MLVISRKSQEAFVIDHPHGPVTVMLVDVRGEKAKLGIDAPKSVQVMRSELLEPRDAAPGFRLEGDARR